MFLLVLPIFYFSFELLLDGLLVGRPVLRFRKPVRPDMPRIDHALGDLDDRGDIVGMATLFVCITPDIADNQLDTV